jgi:hypothetical protein
MLDLIGALRRQVKAADPEKVFLASDCTGSASYAMVTDGTFQDTACKPNAWSCGLFPNWRNVLWSCNWGSVSHFSWTAWGVDNLGTPVSISNGYGDDKGPSEWKSGFRDAIIDLFHRRLGKTRVRFLADDPAKLLGASPDASSAGDAIPVPSAGETNWALAVNGAKATASSEYNSKCGPAGVIDGVRGNSNWMNGHGWASGEDNPLPQWVEISLPQPRAISRFIIVNYGSADDPSLVNTWGVKNYDIETWDAEGNAWKQVVSEKKNRALLNRVHVLERPVVTSRFRVVVRASAHLDGLARLLQVEAWGK